MIAAGEVVERPSGIIKELIENSIDAQASKIQIETKNGGLDLIGVIDDGIGMDKEDLRLAFNRHSTSKIKAAHDLNQIRTLGFRGEALPSIASVAKVVAISNQHQLEIDNSVFGEVEKASSNPGTSIWVSELFYKVPARLKHLKSPQYEHIRNLSLIQEMSLGYPQIAFSLVNDGQMVYQTSGKGDLKEVFYRVYGAQMASQTRTFEGSNRDFKISGLYVLPHFHRANRYKMNLFLNQRLIRYPQIITTLLREFRRYMPSDRFPTLVLNIETDVQLVDVNVHPNKLEVRLSKESDLLLLIEKTLHDSLKSNLGSKEVTRNTFEKPMVISFYDQEEQDSSNWSIKEVSPTEYVWVEAEIERIKMEYPKVEPSFRRSIDVIGQHHGNYILAQDDQSLYIFDQHASMERIEFEKVSQALLNSEFHQQQLLIPLVFENRLLQIENVDETLAHLKQFGLELEPFSDKDLVLRSIPHWLHRNDPYVVVNLILDDLSHDLVSINHKYLATKACHQSVRFNENLSISQLQKIVDDLLICEQPYHCPHGRPTFIKADAKELMKEFSR